MTLRAKSTSCSTYLHLAFELLDRFGTFSSLREHLTRPYACEGFARPSTSTALPSVAEGCPPQGERLFFEELLRGCFSRASRALRAQLPNLMTSGLSRAVGILVLYFEIWALSRKSLPQSEKTTGCSLNR